MPSDFFVPLSSGGRVSARHYPAEAEPACVLLALAHGAGAGHLHPFMVATARDLASLGIDVVTFNFPYTDAGRRVPDKAPVLEACFKEVMAAARGLSGVEGHALFIGGKSMGGRMATHLAAEGIDGLSGVVALGYPLHPPGKPEQLRVAHLSKVRVPLLIVQGERDAFGTPAELAPHMAGMLAGATVHVVVGGDHSLAVRTKGLNPDDVRFGWVVGVSEWMRRVPGVAGPPEGGLPGSPGAGPAYH